MVRRATPREHKSYDVHAVDEFTKTIEETYERFLEENPRYADKWLDRVGRMRVVAGQAIYVRSNRF